MTEAEAVKIASELVRGQYGDVQEGDEPFIARISAALLAASRPGEGMIRTHEGKDLRVLGTLPVTADGCVAGIDAEVWTRPWGGAPEKNHVRTEVPGNPWCGSIPALHCFSTREAASAAKGVGDGAIASQGGAE